MNKQIKPLGAILGEEPFYVSVRFWVSTITPVIAALVSAYADRLPWLSSLDQVALNTWLAGLIVTAVTFVLGRTWRNVAVSGGFAKVRSSSPALPGRVVGLEVVRPETTEAPASGDKEPFYLSKRFWTAVLTPIITAGLGALVQVLPEAEALDPHTVATVIAAGFVAGVGYIVARSARNTRLAIR